jgi:hypothetical protein
MAAKQNRCKETQGLLDRTSLTIVFQQAGNHCLVGYVSTGVPQLVDAPCFIYVSLPQPCLGHVTLD